MIIQILLAFAEKISECALYSVFSRHSAKTHISKSTLNYYLNVSTLSTHPPDILECSQRAVSPRSMGVMGVKWRVLSLVKVAQRFTYTIYLRGITIHLSALATSHFKFIRSSTYTRMVF